jgi:cell division protein FtsB
MLRLRWMFAAAPVVLVLFIAATACCFEVQKLLRLQAAVVERSEILVEKERSIENYREKIDFYSTKEGLAHLARERYNLAFPGERVYMIVSDADSSDRTPRGQ